MPRGALGQKCFPNDRFMYCNLTGKITGGPALPSVLYRGGQDLGVPVQTVTCCYIGRSDLGLAVILVAAPQTLAIRAMLPPTELIFCHQAQRSKIQPPRLSTKSGINVDTPRTKR